MAQRYKFSIESKRLPHDLSGEPSKWKIKSEQSLMSTFKTQHCAQRLAPKDICAFFYGYKYCTIIEQLITGRIHSSDLDKLKKMAVECMKDYIEHSQFSKEEKGELKNNYEHWAGVTLDGMKQRLHDSDKLHE